MNKTHAYVTKPLYNQLDRALKFRLSGSKCLVVFFSCRNQ